jgi:hypothetical protein
LVALLAGVTFAASLAVRGGNVTKIGRKVIIAAAVTLFLGGGTAVAASAMADAPVDSPAAFGPSGSAGIDRGVITVTPTQNAATDRWQFQCSEADTAGPDAARIKVASADDGCLIEGLSATHPFEFTPDGLNSIGLGMPVVPGGQVYAAVYAGLSGDQIRDLVVTFNGLINGDYVPATVTGTYDWMVVLP